MYQETLIPVHVFCHFGERKLLDCELRYRLNFQTAMYLSNLLAPLKTGFKRYYNIHNIYLTTKPAYYPYIGDIAVNFQNLAGYLKNSKTCCIKYILFLFRFCLVLIQWHYSKCVTRWHCQALGCSRRKLHQNYWGWTRGRTLVLCFSASKQQYVCCILFVWAFFFTIRIFIVLDGFISSKETNLSYSYIAEHDIEYEDWNMLY